MQHTYHTDIFSKIINVKISNINSNYRLVLKTKLRFGFTGVCETMVYLLKNNRISRGDYVKLKLHFIRNIPSDSLHQEFFTSKNFIGSDNGIDHWWKDQNGGERVYNRNHLVWVSKSDDQRIKFLEKMIYETRHTITLKLFGRDVVRL